MTGWAVWLALFAYTIVLWFSAFRNPNGGVRFLAAACAMVFSLALALTLALNIPKLHLLWMAVALYFAAMTAAARVIEARVKSAPARAEEESKRTGVAAAEILERELASLGYGPENA